MAEVRFPSNMAVGVEALSGRRGFRLWFDRGRGKYGSMEITRDDLRRLTVMLGSTLGGSAKPSEDENWQWKRGRRTG